MAKAEVGADGATRISGELGFATARGLYEELQRIVADGGEASTLDLGGVDAVDSAGLALLLEWKAFSGRRQRELKVVNAPESLLSLAKLCDAAGILKLAGRNHDPVPN